MGDHREIWLEPKCADESPEPRLWCPDDAWGKCDDCGEPSVKYIRADLAHIAGLKEALKISNDCGKGWRKVGRDHEIFAVATDTVSKTITARIKELEGQ